MKKILILGNSHIAHRLRKKVKERGYDIVETEQPDIVAAFVVYDEETLNVKLSLSIRRNNSEVPIYAIISQDSLGSKIAASIHKFYYVNPARLAAGKFVDSALEDLSEFQIPVKINIRTWSFKPDTLVKRAVSFILGVMLLSTCFFHFSEGMPWIDAFYFTITMWSTVGFGDYSLRDHSDFAKVIGSIIMILCVTGTAMMFALVSDSIVRKRKQLSKGKTSYRGSRHVIVVGGGSVGSYVVKTLLEMGEKPVMLDKTMDGIYAEEILDTKIPFLVGDAKDEKNLVRAGIAKCKALICVTQDDLTNLEVGLDARSLRNDLRIVLRIYDQDLAEDLKSLGIKRSHSMSTIAAQRLVELMERDVLEINERIRETLQG